MPSNRLKWPGLLVCFFVLTMAAAYVAVLDARTEEVNHRTRCERNLREIGQALLLYANDNQGKSPSTIWDEHSESRPVWGTPYQTDSSLAADSRADPFVSDGQAEAKYRPAANDVTAAFFLLLRAEDITAETLVCPSTDAQPWNFGGAGNTAACWTNWQGNVGLASHLSYSIDDPYSSAKRAPLGSSSISAENAAAGDMNPGALELLKLTKQSSQSAMRSGNSFNHRQEGQNILFADGHVEFDDNPFVGVGRDNVYSFGVFNPADTADLDGATGGIIGAPVSRNDSVLLPTANSLDEAR